MTLEDYRAVAERCSRCSYCKWIPFDHVKSWRFAKGCPSVEYNKFQAYSAGGRLAVILSLLEGRSTYTDKIVDIAYKCMTCGSCDVSCKVCEYTIWPLDAIFELRAKLVEDKKVPPQIIPVMKNLHEEDTTFVGKLKSNRGNWAKDLSVKDLSKSDKADVLFYPGCSASYDEASGKIARTTIPILQNAGVDIGIMSSGERCCGGMAYSLGYRDEFEKCAKENINLWNKAGVKTVVTSCANCYWALKRLYPEVGSKFEVLHTVEYIDRLIKQGKLKFTKRVPMKVTYHDPCHLGRQGEPYVPWDGKETKIYNQMVVYKPRRPRYNGAWGIYEPPRDILRSIPGVELIEMERIKEFAWCCGAGGGVKQAYPDFSSWTANERVEEAIATGAEALVSACPWCESNFNGATNKKSMKVFDIIELVQKAI